ncbi:MAG: VOC family protein [Nocardioidaceae bacterium]
MIIDHICFAVRDLDQAIDYWTTAFGYTQHTDKVVNTRQAVTVVFLTKEGSLTVKLIEPLEHNQPLVDSVRRGGGFHHLCFKCDDLDSTIEELRGAGLRMLVPPEPGEAFDNHEIAFLRARFGVNIELIDTDARAGTLPR